MKKILLGLGLLLGTIPSYSQVLLGRTAYEVKKYYWDRSEYPSFTSGKYTDGDSSLSFKGDYYTAECIIDANSHMVESYVLYDVDNAFLASYMKALTEKHTKLSEYKWVASDYSFVIEYRWISQRGKYGFVIKSY